jgi:AraC family transcriptional regulator
MDHYFRIQKAVDFIELNLEEKLCIQDIAAQAFFSPFHFQRLFQAISGFSVQGYIRRRRLTEAAMLLNKSPKSILEIAVSFGYGSQEAFTRAFEGCFGVTPAKYRRQGEISPEILGRINFVDCGKKITQGSLHIDKPHIIQLGRTYIVGHEYSTSLEAEAYFREIPGFYDDFGQKQYYLKLQERIAPAFSYGVSCNYQDDGSFSFLVGEAVRQLPQKLEEGTAAIEIPEGKYAEFEVAGPVEMAQNIWRYIYGVWLPNTNYQRRPGPDFEVTDVCNSRYPEQMSLKIYIPLEDEQAKEEQNEA